MDKLLDSPRVDPLAVDSGTDSASIGEMIEQSIGFVRRQYPIIVAALACTLALGVAYLLTTSSLYTAHTRLMLDTGKLRVLPQQQTFEEFQLDNAQVATQIELLKSDAIGLSVVKELKLTNIPEFVERQPSFLDRIFSFVLVPFSSGDAAVPPARASEDELTRRALGQYLAHRDVTRVGRTYILDISYTSLNRERAATVANGIAQAYILDQLDAKYHAQRRAGKWLQQRIADLRQQAIDADRAVLAFKEKNKIVGTGGAGGRLLGEQQVVDVNSQLADARAAKAGAKAKLDRIQQVMKDSIPDATVADSLRNEIINKLRGQYLDLDRTYHLWASRYGPTHLAVVNLKTQMTQLRRSMHDELGRIAESYKSDYEIAKARETALEESLSHLISGAELTNRDRLGLSGLESRAKVYHSIHDSFLQRYMEMTQQLSFPTTEARGISTASAGGKTSPITSRVLAIASILGLMMGVGIGFLRESLDRVFRTARQIETLLKANCLAILPMVRTVSAASPISESKREPARADLASARTIDPNISGMLRHVVNEPLSSFTEGFRAIKVAADIGGAIKENKVIGVTSSLPQEGKSTVACNLAELIAHGGSKCILVDSDLRNPTLTRGLVPKATVGLLQVLAGKTELGNALYRDDRTGLAFLPVVIESHLAHSSEVVASEAFRRLIDGLRKVYDYVIVDLPPLAPVVDVRATIHSIDSYLYVVEWGRTRINMVERQLGSAPEVFERLLGVALNKANMKHVDRYEDYYGGYYHKKYYARYGYYTQ